MRRKAASISLLALCIGAALAGAQRTFAPGTSAELHPGVLTAASGGPHQDAAMPASLKPLGEVAKSSLLTRSSIKTATVAGTYTLNWMSAFYPPLGTQSTFYASLMGTNLSAVNTIISSIATLNNSSQVSIYHIAYGGELFMVDFPVGFFSASSNNQLPILNEPGTATVSISGGRSQTFQIPVGGGHASLIVQAPSGANSYIYVNLTVNGAHPTDLALESGATVTVYK